MLSYEHSAVGALTASLLTFFWNRRHPDRALSVMWMAIIGAIVARLPDWDIDFVETFNIGGSNWAHRSVYTHSILGIFLFAILVILSIILVNFLRERWGKTNTIPVNVVSFILIIAFATHLMADVLENYPTRFLYPFSSREFSGWIPSSIYKNNSFAFITYIVGFGTAIALSIIQLMGRDVDESESS